MEATLKLFDTDVLIDHLRGHAHAQKELLEVPLSARAISVITIMELVVGARDRKETVALEAFAG